jgi:glycosyltransferase involved in cell wall biosynthesis
VSALLTICIPTFNRAGQLASLLDRLASEAGHTDEVIEVLVADNASDDGTADLLRDAAAAMPWLRIHRHSENLGPAANMQWLIENAPDAEYVWLFGDDDIVVPGGLRTVVSLLRSERPAWLHLPHLWLDETGEPGGGSPATGAVQRYATGREMYCAQHQWLTFMSASVVRRDALQAAVRAVRTDNAYHPLLWFFHAGLHGPCVVAADHIVHASQEISWEDRRHKIMTLDFTSLYDDGLHIGISAEEFGASLDGLYVDGAWIELWHQIPIEALAGVVSRFPQSRGLRGYLWEIARVQGRRDVLDVLDQAARAVGADIEANELVQSGEDAFAAGDPQAAAGRFLEAVHRMPTCICAWNDLAVAAHRLGDPRARNILETALFVSPDDIDALLNRSSMLLGECDYAGAHADASRVIELNPGNEAATELLLQMAG